MPGLGALGWLAIASLASAGVGEGVSIHENDEAQKNAQQAQQSATQVAAQQAATQKQEAIKAAIPNAQAQTGGSLTGAGQQSFANILAGYAGATGNGGTSQTPSNASTVGATNATQPSAAAAPTNITDLLKQLQGGGGNFSGGTNQIPSPDPNFSLSSAY